MKDWRFIKIGNTAHSDKVQVIKNLLAGGWSVEDIYKMLKTEGYEVEKSFIERLKTGNQKVGNESINKQEWSMFKGLTKDAEKEIGNAYKANPELIKILEAWLHNRISEQEARAKIMKITGDKNITDMMIHSPGGFIPAGNSKTGNQSAQDKFLDDINGIKAKYKQEGKEINLSRLMYELKRIGWAESDFTKLKWPANIGNAINTVEKAKTKDEYFKILKFYQTQGYKTKAGEYNPNGRIKLHKDNDSVEIVLVGNSKVDNAQWSRSYYKEKIDPAKWSEFEREFDKLNQRHIEEKTLAEQDGKRPDFEKQQREADMVVKKYALNNLDRARNAMNKKVKNSAVREYKDSQGRIAVIDFNSDGTDADMAIYEDERTTKAVEKRNFSTIRDAEQYVQSHGFRRVM